MNNQQHHLKQMMSPLYNKFPTINLPDQYKNLVLNRIFKGYQNTPYLWQGKVKGLQQFPLHNTASAFEAQIGLPQLRLGKWVEQFCLHQIQQNKDFQPMAAGLQIKARKQTVGELDFLFLFKGQPVHLEVVYKFYLYDHTRCYYHPLEYWIGPNRTDALVYKLNKLKAKQLPLLHRPETAAYLQELGYKAADFDQRVHFKAQLFIPFNEPKVVLKPLEVSCVRGFHFNVNDLEKFSGFYFYIPLKLEWLLEPNDSVPWMNYTDAKRKIEDQCASHRSPMIWLKDPESNLQKAFVTWW